MEEDIKILENLERDIFKACECSLTSSSDKKQWIKEAQAIRNLINKYKEQEKHIEALNSVVIEHIEKNKEQQKIIELMADSIKHYKTVGDGTLNTRPATREEKIGWFRMKAKGE